MNKDQPVKIDIEQIVRDRANGVILGPVTIDRLIASYAQLAASTKADALPDGYVRNADEEMMYQQGLAAGLGKAAKVCESCLEYPGQKAGVDAGLHDAIEAIRALAAKPIDGAPESQETIADHLHIEMDRPDRWLVCVGNIYKSEDDARAACRNWMAIYRARDVVTPARGAIIKEAVNRFLGWKIPKNFGPDCGISFNRDYAQQGSWPIGTNLFSADQARAMFEYCLSAKPAEGGVK